MELLSTGKLTSFVKWKAIKEFLLPLVELTSRMSRDGTAWLYGDDYEDTEEGAIMGSWSLKYKILVLVWNRNLVLYKAFCCEPYQLISPTMQRTITSVYRTITEKHKYPFVVRDLIAYPVNTVVH
jgi:hypothetical protein